MAVNAGKVLIAGLGYLGEALARCLLKEGYTVWGLKRQLMPASALPVNFIGANLTDRASLEGKLPELDYVFYMPAAKQRDPQIYRQTYQEGLQNLLAALPCPPKRLFYVSSTSVYGQSDGSWVDEQSVADPASETGKIISEVELMLLQSVQPVTILRFGGIYGPQRVGFIERVAAGKEFLDKDDGRFTNRIHRDDGAAACLHLLRQEKLEDIYNIVDQDPASRNEVIRWLCEKLGLTLPQTKEMPPHELRGNKRVSNQRLAATGFRYQYPSFREGYLSLLTSWQQGQ